MRIQALGRAVELPALLRKRRRLRRRPRAPAAPAESADVNSFTKVADITRKLYRQTNADAVMSTAVAEIGAQWKISRCIVATRKPGMVPSAVKEYHGEGVKAGEQKP